MPHGYEQTPINDIRNILRDKYNVVDEETLNQTKVPLVNLLLSLEVAEGEDLGENSLDDAEIEDDLDMEGAAAELAALDLEDVEEEFEGEEAGIENVPPAIPDITSSEWPDYVMRQFEDDELENGNPTCDGLRRVTERVLGPIMGRQIATYTPPTIENNGVATVVVGVRVKLTNPNHPLYPMEIYEEDIADCGKYNTDAPYHLHQSGTASTRAEARALRKLLRLRRVVSADELTKKPVEEYEEGWRPSEPISQEQINMIDVVCERLNMSVMDFVNSGKSGKKYPDIYAISHATAQEMMQFLNRIQQNKASKPHGVGNYDKNWNNRE